MSDQPYPGHEFPANPALTASRGDIRKHIANLWPMSFKELAEDCARDPSESNIYLVRIVADMRLAEANAAAAQASAATADATRRLTIATYITSVVALAVGVASFFH